MKLPKIILVTLFALACKQVKSQSDSLKLYPNPFNTTINLNIYLINTDTVNVLVYNLNGQLVQTFINDSIMSTGSHTMLCQTPTLPAGVYMVKITTRSYTHIQKIIKEGGTYNAIQEVSAKTSIVNAYPNPTNDVINIQSETGLGLIIVYNSLGELLYMQTTKDKSAQIDINQQTPGLYLIKVQNQNIRVIKQ